MTRVPPYERTGKDGRRGVGRRETGAGSARTKTVGPDDLARELGIRYAGHGCAHDERIGGARKPPLHSRCGRHGSQGSRRPKSASGLYGRGSHWSAFLVPPIVGLRV